MFSINIRGTEYKAATLAGISAAYCKARDESGEGASTFPFPDVRIKGRDGKEITVARMSYNGRVWPNAEYEDCAGPFCDPAADPVADMVTALQECIAVYEATRDEQPTGHLWPDPTHIHNSRRAIEKAESART